MAEDLYSFGSWVRLRRQALVLSREKLALQVGVAEVSIRKIEADERRPSPQVAALLAQQLQLAPEAHALFVQVARGVLTVDQLPPPIPRASFTSSAAPTPAHPLLPSGTVTFLFTDIEGSTRLWELHPERMPAMLARYDAILRGTLTAHDGQIFKTIGDAVCASFSRAPDALAAALAAQRALQVEPWDTTERVAVRMALHTATAEAHQGDYLGLSLSRAARLLAVGHGGQILLSLATEELVREHLPVDVGLRDLGRHRLKDLTVPEQIFQLVAPDLPFAFPPLRTLDARATNLPAQPTALIGRDQEVAALSVLLRRSDVRLVTLTGPGGIGKTRLGLQVAAELLDDFPDGVYFVDLAPISDPDLVVASIGQALDVRDSAGRPPAQAIHDYLRARHMLLLLDNFEQVLAAAPAMATLLAACPRIKVLVTSRTALHLRGEKEFAVPPLSLPDPQQLPPLAALSQYSAVALFIARAQDAQPAFAVTNDTAPSVAEICHRLDGLPLAIELAAARIKLFAPEALLARLSRRLPLLTGGARDLPERQQTLRAAIDWSYNLLTPAEQRLFSRLAVFLGGCTIEAAAAACNLHDDLLPEVLDGLALLVDSSMLRREEGAAGEPRFLMLETIREYALEQMDQSGELQEIHRRHAEYFLRLAEEADTRLQHMGIGAWLNRLEAERDNLHAALAWTIDGGDGELGCRLVVALAGIVKYAPSFSLARGFWSKGYQWLKQALEKSSGVPPTLLAMTLSRFASLFASFLLPIEQVMALNEEALALFRAAGDRRGIAQALLELGQLVLYDVAEYPRATQLFEESLALYRELGDQRGSAAALHYLGDCAREQGDLARAKGLLEQSIAIFRGLGANDADLSGSLTGLGDVLLRQGNIARATALYWEAARLLQNVDRWSMLWPLRNLAWLALVQGDDGRVRALLDEHVGWCRDNQQIAWLALVLHILGALVGAQGDATQATALLHEALAIQQEVYPDFLKEGLDGCAWLATGQGQAARAARLLGAAGRIGTGGIAAWSYAHHQLVAVVRAQLDEGAFAAAWAEGQAMPREQTLAYALGEDD